MLPIRDKLRVICHDLRMRALSGIDDLSVFADLQNRINHLPSPESILVMKDDELLGLRNRLDKLMYDVDRADKRRTHDHAVRHWMDKGLPPYRKPLFSKTWYQRIKTAMLNDEELNSLCDEFELRVLRLEGCNPENYEFCLSQVRGLLEHIKRKNSAILPMDNDRFWGIYQRFWAQQDDSVVVSEPLEEAANAKVGLQKDAYKTIPVAGEVDECQRCSYKKLTKIKIRDKVHQICNNNFCGTIHVVMESDSSPMATMASNPPKNARQS